MREESVEFLSDGTKVGGVFRLPDQADGPLPVILQGPGWLGLSDQVAYVPWHTALTDAGYAVLCIDYRGFGRSDGERGWMIPDRMVEDLINAVTYLETRPEIDPRRIGAFGMGAMGAGNAVMLAAKDRRIGCVAVQSVMIDGELWLRRMRREYEWVEFQRRVAEDARRWVTTGESELVDPRAEIMIAAPERGQYTGKKDADAKIAPQFHLQSAAALMRYKPIEHAHRIAPRGLLVITVANDVVTPDDQAQSLYDAAGEPKRLVRQHGTTHYESYTKNYELISREIVQWFDRHLTGAMTETAEAPGA